MYKGNKKANMRVLSLLMAVGISVSGLPVSAMAAEAEEEPVRQEIVTEQAVEEDAASGQELEENTESGQELEESAESGQETAEDADSGQEPGEAAENAQEAESASATDREEENDGSDKDDALSEEESAEEAPAEDEVEVEQENNEAPETLDGADDVAVKGEVEDISTNAQVVKSGWYQAESGEWYYYVDGEPLSYTVKNINGSYYGFDFSGRMFDGERFSIYDSETDNNVYYQAQSGGKLYVNSWYKLDGSWYYYGAEGKGANGVLEIKGVLYAFEFGWMLTSTTYEDGSATYVIDENGVATNKDSINGWYRKVNGNIYGPWQYFVKGDPLCNQVRRIGQYLYAFDEDGYMVAGEDYHFYLVDENGSELFYHAHENGTLYENAWCQDSYGEWYYHGKNGVGAEGLLRLSGKLYAFRDGKMLTDEIYYDSTGTYIVNSKGIATSIGWVEGWNNLGGKWYYYENGHAIKNEIKKIGSNYYGFDHTGQMYQSRDINIYDEGTNEIICAYRAKANGALYVNSWYQDDLGQWFYYGADGKGVNGPQKVGGKLYCFNNGYMYTNWIYVSDAGTYRANSNGAATKLNLANGWQQLDGNWYYFVSGKAIFDEVRKIGNYYYLLCSDGRMLKSGQYHLYDKKTGEYIGEYRAKSDGKLLVNEWYEEKFSNGVSFWHFYGVGGLAANGVLKVGGKLYAFSQGIMEANTTYYDETGTYEIDEYGIATKIDAPDYGWKYIDGGWYWFENGEIVKNEIIMTYPYRYALDETGRRYDGEEFERVDEESGETFYYRALSGGALVINDWYSDENGDWYYYGNGGKGAEGVVRINDYHYLFKNAKLLRNGLSNYNGSLYMTDSSGIAYKINSGWNQVEGYWYYFENNKKCTGWKLIGSKWYYFRDNGAMCTGWLKSGNAWYYLKGSGAMCTGWQQISGKWYYFSGSGAMCTGWQQIGGKWYYFNGSGAMLTGRQQIGGKWYTFNSSGALQ